MSGLILPDVPYEEKEEFDVILKKYGLDLISMIAPTSHQRIQTIAKDAGGFIYCVSSLVLPRYSFYDYNRYFSYGILYEKSADIPVEVGFGISTPEQAKKMADQSNGAIVKIVEKYGKDAPKYVEEYVKEMVQSIK